MKFGFRTECRLRKARRRLVEVHRRAVTPRDKIGRRAHRVAEGVRQARKADGLARLEAVPREPRRHMALEPAQLRTIQHDVGGVGPVPLPPGAFFMRVGVERVLVAVTQSGLHAPHALAPHVALVILHISTDGAAPVANGRVGLASDRQLLLRFPKRLA